MNMNLHYTLKFHKQYFNFCTQDKQHHFRAMLNSNVSYLSTQSKVQIIKN